MALGADAPDLLRYVMSQGLALTLRVVLGAAAALGLTRLLGYLLYKVSPRDPAAFASVLVVMIIASLAALSTRLACNADRPGSGVAKLIPVQFQHAPLSPNHLL